MKRKNKPQLAIEHAETLAAKIENEGELDYVLENWEFKEFRDKKFTSLRKAFIKAKTDLMDYAALWRLEDSEFEDGVMENNGIDDYWDVVCKVCGDSLTKDGCPTCTDDTDE
jgi:hypothetical protein